ncbi:MAG TPA: tetratricopeptide repeat protein [Polyangia bacterium]|jgi:tetratricopeptide (TPR) repeat protein|nr:tetratricopeptide repeat protein [Polyangia bacterium]
MATIQMKQQTGRGLGLGLILTGGLAFTLGVIGCGSSPPPKARHAGNADEEAGTMGGEATEHDTISKAGAAELIPKEKKRAISEDQRADFEKAMQRYASAKKSGGLTGGECSSVSDAFKSVADSNPGLLEARFNQGAVLSECGREDEAQRVWRGMTNYGPAITNLGYAAWKRGERGEAESDFNHAIQVDPLHTVEARNNLAQILRDKARRASGDEKKQYVAQAVSNLRTALALDSNNLQAFSTLAFIYYDMNMLEMAKLVGNQAIAKADEIATGKFAEEKVEEAAEGKAGKGKKGKKEKKESGDDTEGGKLAKEVNVREEGTGVTPEMKKSLATVYNTLGLIELKKKNISPAIKQFKQAVELNPKLAEARLNLAVLSLNNRDYNTAEENFRKVIELQPKNYEAAIGLGVALRGNKKIDEAEQQYNSAEKLDPSNPWSYFNLGLLYQDYKDGQKPALHKAQDYYREFLGHANDKTAQRYRDEAEKRIKDIDEIYVALDEAAKMQAEAEAMQKKAEEQQKQMEEQMKKQEADEAAAAAKAKEGGDKGAAPGAPGAAAPAGDADKAAAAAAPTDDQAGGGKKKKKKK